MSVPEGPTPNTDVSGLETGKYHYRFHSDDVSVGRQSALVSLVTLWNNGYTPYGATLPAVSALECRNRTLVLLKLFVVRKQAVAAGSNPLNPTRPSQLPALFDPFWMAARLSTVAVEIGSVTIKHRKAHIDIDWFGPMGTSESSNWWRPSLDGEQAEVDTAQALIAFLEQAIARDLSNASSSRWHWGAAVEAIALPKGFAGIESRVIPRSVAPLRLEWWVRDSTWSPPLDSFQFHTADGGQTLIIETPDVSGPDPN